MFFGGLSIKNNQEWKVRPEIVDVNSNESLFYAFSIKTSKYSGSWNNIHDTYTKLCIPDTVKNLNIKVFNLVSIFLIFSQVQMKQGV